MIAFLEARRAGLFRRGEIWRNVVAGSIVGVVALPLAMAFAIASGAEPEQGIYTAIIAGLATSLLGGTRVQVSGPTGAFIVVLAGITSQFGIAGLQVATLMAGLMLLAMGFAKLGGVIRFIPNPVITGFTSGIAVIIWVGQWKYFFGLNPDESGAHFHEDVWALVQSLPDLHIGDDGDCAPFLDRGRDRKPRARPHSGSLARAGAPRRHVAGNGRTSRLAIPRRCHDRQRFRRHPAGTSGVAVAESFAHRGDPARRSCIHDRAAWRDRIAPDCRRRRRHDGHPAQPEPGTDRAGRGQHPFAIVRRIRGDGAIARTATNIRNGATSPLAGIVHSIFLILVIVLLAPWAAQVPLAALAAILFHIAWNMSDVRHFSRLLTRAAWSDRLVLLITFGLTVFVDLVVAVNVGVVIAALLFMRRMAETVSVQQEVFGGPEDRGGSANASQDAALPANVLVYRIDGPFFFGAAEKLESTVERAQLHVGTVVIRLGRVPFMDATGMHTLSEIIERFQRRGIRVVLCEIQERLARALARAEILALVGPENVCADMAEVARRVAPTGDRRDDST